ncbi:MAG TPA: metallophosphoesterase [Desulfuromonadaceae bacterium]|jgi:serine/threonine protein phosphatase 1
MANKRFVIGDVHGCARTLRRLVEVVLALAKDDELYLLGDLIDRGPDSRGVLDFIFDLIRQGFSVMSVKGNHEDMCLRARHDLQFLEMWLINGGHATLDSFSVEAPDEIPHDYRSFLQSLPHYILLHDFVIVHAGLNFYFSNPFSDTDAMLWQRDCTAERNRIGGRRLVSGHTAVTKEQLEASLKSDRIMIDNGCVFNGRTGLGSLAALELNSMVISYQKNIER